MSQDFRLYDSADVWNQAMQLGQQNLLHALIDFWPADVTSALDVGCGDGKLTRVLAVEKQIPIVGFDSSHEALSRLPLPTVQGDAVNMPFGDASFDLVLSTDTLEHVPDASHAQVWSEIFRVARRQVMVAVPFREELLDATTLCQQCGQTYHVNWHERSYDFEDLRQRAPQGWRVQTFVVSGEAWPDLLPTETRFRRTVMDQWSGWAMAVCPHCGASGHEPTQHQPLPKLTAAALGQHVYASLKQQRVWRSHSEVLCIYEKINVAHAQPRLPQAESNTGSASQAWPGTQGIQNLLVSYPQVARCVQSTEAGLIIQFPVYDNAQALHVQRAPGSSEGVEASMEDGLGILFSGCILEPGQPETTIRLARQPMPGMYGVLLRTQAPSAIGAVSLGNGPVVTWLAPRQGEQMAYHPAQGAGSTPTWIQITGPTWLDDSFWHPQAREEGREAAIVLAGMEQLAGELQVPWQAQLQQAQSELEVERVHAQNLSAERDALLARAGEADRLVVTVENLRAERDALLARASEADRLAVDVENLQAERDALLTRANEADQLAVDVENLRAERDALRARASEADRLAVDVENLQAERDALLTRASEADRLVVDVENLQAERDALLMRAGETDQLAVDVQNLSAERDALLVRAREADRLAVDVQNLSAERDALLVRAREADQLAVDVQNLQAANEQLTRLSDAMSTKPRNHQFP